MTRAILFDLDDTLFDHRHSTREALAAIHPLLPGVSSLPLSVFEERHALVLEELHLKVLAGDLTVDAARLERFRRLAHGAGGNIEDAVLDSLAVRYRQHYLDSRRSVPGVIDVLAALKPHVKIAVISNNVVAEQIDKMAVCGLRGYVDVAVISEEVGIAKPHARIFEIALERLGVRTADALMVGDSWHADILGARAAGLRAVWFNPRLRAAPDGSDIPQLRSWQPPADIARQLLVWVRNDK
jgi:putative hydrolase of the HAD superfamily